MRMVHLTASTFFGGPERQMLGLAQALSADYITDFLSFSEGGNCRAFLQQIQFAGFSGLELQHDTPHLRGAISEIADYLHLFDANILCCHGYKANLLGRIAARRSGIPAISISRGWTGETVKVRVYEAMDRFHLRYMDHVVCVSDGQARKVRRTGVPARKISIIRNAARLDAFAYADPSYRAQLAVLFSKFDPQALYILAAGRLSPEKGFDVLVEAAKTVCESVPAARFVLFGEGAQRPILEERIAALGLRERFLLAGFRNDLDRWLPWADLVVLPSYTEGLPNVALEASAAGVAVVATAVGGTPEVIRDGQTGYLVPPGQPGLMAERIVGLLRDEETRKAFGTAARALMYEAFTFEAQAQAYDRLFQAIAAKCRQTLVGAK
jgi:glycosyltransferase involved in cell wall biosynthesis